MLAFLKAGHHIEAVSLALGASIGALAQLAAVQIGATMDPVQISMSWIELALAYSPVFITLAAALKAWVELRKTAAAMKKVEHRSNSLHQLNLEQFVDLHEQLLEQSPNSKTAIAKLDAARQRLADHIAAEKKMEGRG